MLPFAILGYLALLAGLIGATQIGAVLAARVLDVPDFRWFDSEPASSAWLRRFGVRLLSALASLGVCLALFFCAYFFGGDRVPSTTVLVRPGAARDAGMLDGDRLVAIDGKKLDNWETARTSIQAGRARQIEIEIERAGTSRVLHVTPNAERHIGVAPLDRVVALGAAASAQRAAAQPFEVIRSTLQGAVGNAREKPLGPIGMVRETANNADRKATAIFWVLGCLGAYLWPALASFQVFDAATLWFFGKTHPGANRGEPLWRLARLQQALVLSLLSIVALLACYTIDQLGPLRSVSGPLFLLLLPAGFALVPLTWLAGKHFWGAGRASLIVAAAMLVPCAAVLVALLLLQRARRELRARGYRIGLLVVREQADAPQ